MTPCGSASANARIVLSTTRCTWQKREKHARGNVGLKIEPLRCDHLDRPEHTVVLRHVLGKRDLVEQDRAHCVVGADEQRALVGDVVAGRHLRVRARQVDRDLVTLDDHLRLDAQAHVAVASVVVEPARSAP